MICDSYTCDFCEGELPLAKLYDVMLDFNKDIRAQGHKYCMITVNSYYKAHGKKITKKELELQSFDPQI